MRSLLLAALVLAASLASAEKVLLIPLDSRPAAGQFAQMIGNISAADVLMPPYETLGRFTVPGEPDQILSWLEKQDLSDVTAVVASTDMIAYGGLIQSRSEGASKDLALARIDRMVRAVKRSPKTRLYAFSAIMRLAPTATNQTRPWRMDLAAYYEAKDRWVRTRDQKALAKMKAVEPIVPLAERQRYERTRKRNHEVQRGLIHRAARRDFDYLVLGQDDAKAYGPFIAESAALRKLSEAVYAGGLVFFCEGIDQHAAVLVSRALLKHRGWTPKVRVVYSDDLGRKKFANYESKPVEASLADQILASGARIAGPQEAFDYTLYLNTPKPRKEPFDAWLSELVRELDAGKPVAVADINLGSDGIGDSYLWAWLRDRGRMMRLISYAAWNTAGNTMGTAIPAANLYMLGKVANIDPLRRELAQKEFLLHRLVNDYSYHRFSRPVAYQLIDRDSRSTREETYGQQFNLLNEFVRKDMGQHLQRTFDQQFKGKRFLAGDQEYQFESLSDVKVFLPWPRAYEVRLSFQLGVQPAPKQVLGG